MNRHLTPRGRNTDGALYGTQLELFGTSFCFEKSKLDSFAACDDERNVSISPPVIALNLSVQAVSEAQFATFAAIFIGLRRLAIKIAAQCTRNFPPPLLTQECRNGPNLVLRRFDSSPATNQVKITLPSLSDTSRPPQRLDSHNFAFRLASQALKLFPARRMSLKPIISDLVVISISTALNTTIATPDDLVVSKNQPFPPIVLRMTASSTGEKSSCFG
eukprot:CAMPEP_0113608540 /NCGR_PEP_ID=MMETSP0017_2-20120614/3989_1 /TAXON_ID=2856 /ORGANISM="Cylindrotheca closterium" /LENGTH=217 /DNA_ID=CAMNT_0000517251 /DNA_START=381 /DNA_END=1035 /DNA_ORIENTATION=+ /assembly_acc=CAM_ASM_000147